jgi:glycosyltransferase involved in cell wall biosynthesis
MTGPSREPSVSPSPGDTPWRVSVVVPFYNEMETIEACLAGVREVAAQWDWCEIIVVDDGSTEIDRGRLEPLCDKLLRHATNRGYGAALLTGFRAAEGDVIAFLDADGTYPPAHLTDLVDRLAEADMAVGDRRRGGGSRRPIEPWHRRLAKAPLRKVAAWLARADIGDLNSGMRAFRRAHLERFGHLVPDGFSLTTTMTLAFLCEGLRVEFVPIEYGARRGDAKSKIRPVRDTMGIFLTILRTVAYYKPLSVFGSLAVLFGLSALVVLIVGLIVGEILDGTIAVLAIVGAQLFGLGLLADLVVRSRR